MSETYGTFSKAYVEAMRLRLSALEPENKGLLARVAELEARCKQLEDAGDAMAEWNMSERNPGCDPELADKWQQAKEARP